MAIIQRSSLLPPKATGQRGSQSRSKLELHSFASFDNAPFDSAVELVPGNLPAHWMAPQATAFASNEDAQVNEFVTPTGEVMTQRPRHHYLYNLRTPFPTDNVFNCPRERAISSTRRNVETQEKSFDEENEDRPSCLRKRVLPHSTIGWTRNCVVLDQKKLPDYLFTDLSLIDSKGWLVEDFSYEKLERQRDETPPNGPRDWKIIYDRKDVADKEDYGYVKVITKNSYWAELLWTLVKGGMVFAMTEYSHFAFMNSCSDDEPLFGSKDKPLWFGKPKSVIGICWLVFAILRLVAATLSAKLEWHADTESGPDIIRESSSFLSPEEEARILKQTRLSTGTLPKMSFSRKARPLQQWKSFLALVVFQLVGVPGILRDITVFLHPWKGLQPYAAFKADGARAYLLGFPHGSLYRIENRPRAEMRYMLTFLMTLLLSCLKIKIRLPRICNQDRDYNMFNLIIELFPSALTLGISLVGCLRLLKSKRRCRQWLEAQLQSSDAKQQQVAQRLLKKHYGIYFKISSTTGTSNVKAQEQEALKQCTDRCAELARELQLWKVNAVLGDQLKTRGVDPVDAERFLYALRDIAGPALPLNDSLRGPHIANEPTSSR